MQITRQERTARAVGATTIVAIDIDGFTRIPSQIGDTPDPGESQKDDP